MSGMILTGTQGSIHQHVHSKLLTVGDQSSIKSRGVTDNAPAASIRLFSPIHNSAGMGLALIVRSLHLASADSATSSALSTTV